MLLHGVGRGTSSPLGFTHPPWSSLADSWDKAPLPPSPTVTLGPETISLGHNDSENDDASKEVENHEFGWDDEHPQRQVEVGEFRIDWRPVSNGDFYKFYNSGRNDKVEFPKGWCMVGDEVHVRSFPTVWFDVLLKRPTGPYLLRSCSDENRPFVARHDHVR